MQFLFLHLIEEEEDLTWRRKRNWQLCRRREAGKPTSVAITVQTAAEDLGRRQGAYSLPSVDSLWYFKFIFQRPTNSHPLHPPYCFLGMLASHSGEAQRRPSVSDKLRSHCLGPNRKLSVGVVAGARRKCHKVQNLLMRRSEKKKKKAWKKTWTQRKEKKNVEHETTCRMLLMF